MIAYQVNHPLQTAPDEIPMAVRNARPDAAPLRRRLIARGAPDARQSRQWQYLGAPVLITSARQ